MSQGYGATYAPGRYDDIDYYHSPPRPQLVAPEPQRVNAEMANQVADGLQQMSINGGHAQAHNYANLSTTAQDTPHLSPFPKLINPPPNTPQSDEELEATLENARTPVLNSNDPEMQLAWAEDALMYAGVCADDEERRAAATPHAARSSTPRIEHQLKTDAMNIVTFLADQHHPKSEFLKGMWLEWGRFGQREDKKEAFRCYSRAADRGYARAEYRIGMLYESYNDPIKALRHYHRGVEVGDAASCYRLGMMTLRGQHGQQQDYAKAIDLIKRSAVAADANAAQGAYVYGMLLAKQLPQIDVPASILRPDDQQARVWIEKAAYLKFAKAQAKMGAAYELAGLGCEFNPALSVHYNALASKQGETEADMALSKWFLVGSEGLFPKNEELAYTYAERAAAGGLATAEFALGYFHEIGMYVPVDLNRAMEWYQKASQHGNTDAQNRIDGLSRKQVLNKRDHEQVAVQRIKSTYGSMRGGRPARFQHGHQSQNRVQHASIPETEQTDQRLYSMNGRAPVSNGGHNAPARGTTPYPLDNGPPVVDPGSIRLSSTTPYPVEDGPQAWTPAPRISTSTGHPYPQPSGYPPQRPAATVSPIDTRPSSAFQINPDLRPNSAMVGPQSPQTGAYGQSPTYGGGRPPLRQYQSANPAPLPRPTHATSANPSGVYDPRPPHNAGHRIVSGPAGMQSPAPHTQPPPIRQTSTIPPGRPLDIGFTAPPDERRNRTYGPSGNAGRPQPSPNMNTNGVPVNNRPPPQNGTRPMSSQPLDPYANSGGGGSGATPRPLAPPQRESASLRPANPPASAPPPAEKPSAPPPKKGPQTFEEMGVPNSKPESECVSFHYLIYTMLCFYKIRVMLTVDSRADNEIPRHSVVGDVIGRHVFPTAL
nr:chitin synthase regulatory factor 4 [Quercus suber]